MKRLAIILLFCLSATAQTIVLQAPPSNCRTVPEGDGCNSCTECDGVLEACTLVYCKPMSPLTPPEELEQHGGGGCPLCELEKRVDKLDQRAAMQFKVLVEYSLMQAELEDMHDQRVNRIMNKHLPAIKKYVEQMKELDGEK